MKSLQGSIIKADPYHHFDILFEKVWIFFEIMSPFGSISINGQYEVFKPLNLNIVY